MPSCTTPIRLQLKPAYERMRQVFTFASSDRNKVKAEADDPKTKLAPPPHFVTYSDESNPPDVSKITGFNIFALSFLLISGPADQALEWTLLSASKRTQIKNSYAAAGIKIIVSAFGSTDAPTSVGADPVKTANTMAAWVKQWGLDGIDVDYEDFNAFNDGTTRAVTWIVSFTKQLRSKLPVEQYIITHAPVAPWFQKGYAGGGYLSVHTQVGNQINWYNVQFYNQESEYETIDGLLNKSGPTYPGSALFQIHANGVAMEKLVIGKPAAKSDAIGGGQGFMSTTTLAQAIAQAAQKGWNGGVMTWEFPRGNASWIKTVRGSTFPE